MTEKKKKVAIIGGGISGLTVAYELEKTDMEVTLIEKGDRLGGTIQTVQEDGFLIDPNAEDIVDFLLFANSNRHVLREASQRIKKLPVRTVDEMVGDYYQVRDEPVGIADALQDAESERVVGIEH